jgi:hypothetical protein
MKLYRAVDEVLHYLWDPIGVAGMADARDEYQAYLPEVFRLLVQGSDEQAIAEYLGTIATARMGLPSRPERDLEAARTAIGWKQVLIGTESR